MAVTISASQEDYLESIYIIQSKKNIVRVKDIAEFINVKAPSVIEALSNLQKKGLVLHERYGHIELTTSGLLKAKKLYEKHIALCSSIDLSSTDIFYCYIWNNQCSYKKRFVAGAAFRRHLI